MDLSLKLGSFFTIALLIIELQANDDSVPMSSGVPQITYVKPEQSQAGPKNDLKVRQGTFVDPETGQLAQYKVETFENASGQQVEQYTNLQTGKVTSKVMDE